ncbi:hypothetical protein CKO_04349 [Citrobacter koseri ATCC BAA-895]|uniref:Uncharacterized protein n=1 Tax=Citrobacter koseri (strain ATCC BAA-895 / CDC 4225-83 / SGSC4696) TaxID=290338 RepID=A8APJ3_CITK8|nr:hypothetical protein CKO_04349 [Citrobacter koseri ATCC BAA-895]
MWRQNFLFSEPSLFPDQKPCQRPLRKWARTCRPLTALTAASSNAAPYSHRQSSTGAIRRKKSESLFSFHQF